MSCKRICSISELKKKEKKTKNFIQLYASFALGGEQEYREPVLQGLLTTIRKRFAAHDPECYHSHLFPSTGCHSHDRLLWQRLVSAGESQVMMDPLDMNILCVFLNCNAV